MDYYKNEVSIYDVVKYLFEAQKDQHAEGVLRLIEELKLLQGKLEAHYEQDTKHRKRGSCERYTA